MLNPSFYNPAWVGTEPQASVTMQFRSQWLGYSSTFDGSGGAPNTQLVSAIVPVKGIVSGLGAIIVNDNIGPVNDLNIQFPISYSFRTRRGQYSVGLMPGFIHRTLNGDDLRPNNPIDGSITQNRESLTNANLGAGFVFNSDRNFFIGVSASNLLRPAFDFALESSDNTLETSFAAISGFNYYFNQDIVFKPSVLVRTDLDSYTFDISLLADIQSRAWGGLSYRRAEALVFLVGYSFLPNNRLKVGYALDYILNEREAKQATSQEVYIRYNLSGFVFGGKKEVKTPRFTF